MLRRAFAASACLFLTANLWPARPKGPIEIAISIAEKYYPSLCIAAAHGGVPLARTGYYPRSNFFWRMNLASANQLSSLFVPMTNLISIAVGNTSQNWQGYRVTFDRLVLDEKSFIYDLPKSTIARVKNRFLQHGQWPGEGALEEKGLLSKVVRQDLRPKA